MRGFTLLEVLIALSIIATAMVGLLSLHARNLQIVAYDQDLSRATWLAERLMTRTIVEQPFPDPVQASGQFDEDPRFQWEVRIVAGPTPELEDDVREIHVRVFWNPADPEVAHLITHVRKPDV